MDDYIFSYIFKNEDWEQCSDLIGWQHGDEDWEVTTDRVGLQSGASHKIGNPNGFFVEVYARISKRLFEPEKTVTHLIVVTTNDDWTHYYCTGHHIMHKKFAELATISLSEHVSSELTWATARIEAREAA